MCISNLLVEEAGAHWVCPSSISFFCLCGKSKGNYWPSVIICVSIGNHFNFPVEWWCLEIKIIDHLEKLFTKQRLKKQISFFSFSCLIGHAMTKCWRAVRSHLYWHWGGGIDKGAPRKAPTCTGISQEGHSSEVRGEHAGSHWGEHPGWAPRDFFGLQTQQSSLFHQPQFKSPTKIQPNSLSRTFNTTPTNHIPIEKFPLNISRMLPPVWAAAAGGSPRAEGPVLTCLLSACRGGGGGRAQSRYNIRNLSHCISTTTSLSPATTTHSRHQPSAASSSPTEQS